MAIKITTSINSGTKGAGGKSAIDSFYELAEMFDHMPERIESVITRAALLSKDQIQANMIKRGSAGKYFQVTVRKHGPFGLKVVIEQTVTSESSSINSSSGHNPFIGSKIFFQSEMGYQGRRSYTSPRSEETKVMKFQRWGASSDTNFFSHVNIPSIGKYYFSKKSGVKQIPIKKMAFDTISENLNRNFRTITSRNSRVNRGI